MTAEKPACPNPAHAGSRVVRNGVYGSLGRQRCRCHPVADASHTFSTAPEMRSLGLADDTERRSLRSYRHTVIGVNRLMRAH